MSKTSSLVALAALVCLAAVGCGEDSGGAPDGGAKDAGFSGADVAAAQDAQQVDASHVADTGMEQGKCEPKKGKIGELKFGAPVAWATPIQDYIDFGFKTVPSGKFLQGVQDLVVFEDRLYIGYGDANINLGSKKQLAIRYFDSCSSTQTTDEFKHDEEQIDRYRIAGDELWIAGVDATEDGWLGNVYRKVKGKAWVKHRTVGSGVHVHDVARFDGSVFAVGSGNTPEGWKEGEIYGFLWRSNDDGKTFVPVDKEWNESVGDSRMVHLVPTGNRLYLFGYKINNQGQLKSVPNKVWDGKEAKYLAQGHPLQLAFIRGAWRISDDAGVVTGQDLLEGNNPPMRAYLLTAKGAAKIDGLKGHVVVDIAKRADTGEFLVVTRPGTSPAAPTEGAKVQWKVRLTTDFSAFSDVIDFELSTNVQSIAWWQGGIYLGTSSGYVFRSMGK